MDHGAQISRITFRSWLNDDTPQREMLAVCLWDLRAAFRHPLPWQRDLYV